MTMCIFRSRSTPAPVAPAPQPIQPRQPNLVEASRLPGKKELLDPDEVAGVEYGTTAKKEPKGTAQRTGTDALKINLGTGGGETGSESGGLNV